VGVQPQFMNPARFFVLPFSLCSSAPRCLLPTHRPPWLPAPHMLATSALPWSRPADHAPPYPDLAPPASVAPRPTARIDRRPRPASSVHRPPGPAPLCPGHAPSGRTPPSSACRPPDPVPPCPSRAPPDSARRLPGPAPLSSAPPYPAHRVGGSSPPAPAPPVRVELLIVLNFFLA
jgi:hypothetical protein